tara:strand:- start:1653 stop:2507 length:855 start_codon:yes stop_codon:yes gene_type:complete
MTRKNGTDEVSKNVINFLKNRFGSSLTKTDQDQLQSMIGDSQAGARTKDPNKPKRGNSAYIYFCEDLRPQVTKEHPDCEAKQIIGKLAELWKKAKQNPADVKRYYDLAEKDKERYHSEMKDYTPPATAKRGKKDPGLPKKAKSAYLFFYEDKRPGIVEANPGTKATDITRIIGAQWTKIKDIPSETDKYVKLAEKDKTRYTKEMQSVKKGGDVKVDEVEEVEVEVDVTKDEGYEAFSKKMKKALKAKEPDASDGEIAKRLSSLWKDLDSDARGKFAKTSKKGKK